MKTIISLLSIDLRKTVNERQREKQFDRERNWGELEVSRALFVQSRPHPIHGPRGVVQTGFLISAAELI